MATTYRITLWSGGQPAMVSYTKESPAFKDGMLSFRNEDGQVMRLIGSISIEEGEFSEQRPINTMRMRRG